MKYVLFLLFTSFYTNSQAQRSSRDSYDTFAKFPEYSGDIVAYLADQIQKPANITLDAKQVLAITIQIDTAGKMSVLNMPQRISPEVDAEFVKAVQNAPVSKPAKLKGKPVNIYFTGFFDVEMNKTANTMVVNVQGRTRRPDIPDENAIYTAVATPPSFPGGEKEFVNFYRSHMQYPQVAKKNNIQGRVIAVFVIEKDGSLSDIKIIRDPGDLGEEAIRLLKASPRWTPGIQNGKTVRVQYTEAINFML